MKQILFAVLILLPARLFAAGGESSLWPIQKALTQKKYVDLTHEFAPGIPRWPGFPDETRKTIYWYDKRPDTIGVGFFSELFTHVGQWGTHVDPPAHFVKGLRTVDQIDPKEMILPLVVIDVHCEAAARKSGKKITARSQLEHLWRMRTDWSKRWPDGIKMENKDANGVAHYPGWSLPALKYLYEERKITASGHETTDTDPGIAASKDDYSLETYVLSTNHYQIELLTNLDQCPKLAQLSWPLSQNQRTARVFPASLQLS